MLAFVMMLCLAACGAEDDDDSDKKEKEPTEKAAEATPTTPAEDTPVVTEPAGKDPTEAPTPAGQDPTEAPTPAGQDPTEAPTPAADPKTVLVLPLDETIVVEDHLPEVTFVEATDASDMKFNLYTTALCAPKDEVIAQLKEDAWLNSKGVVADYYREEGTRNPGLTVWRVSHTDGLVIAGLQEKGSESLDLYNNGYLWYEYDTFQFTNENRVVFSIENVDLKSAEEMENVERVVKLIFGEELGNVLLKAKEIDADRYAEAPNEIRITVEKDEIKYLFSRSVIDLDKEKAQLAFALSVQPKRIQYPYYENGYEKQIANFGGLPNEVFEGNFGGDNILDFDTFADNLCDFKDQIGISLVYYDATRYISPDGRQLYDMSFEVNDEFKLEYEYGIVNGVTDHVSGLELKMKTKPFPKSTEEGVVPDGLYDELNRSLEGLLGYNPGITQEMLKKSDSLPVYIERIPLKIKVMGFEKEEKFQVEAYCHTDRENRGVINIY